MHKNVVMRLKIMLIILAVITMTSAVQAQLRFGLKGGVAVNRLHFDKSLYASENRSGFTAGIQLEFSLPVTGLALDGSLMFSHRTDALTQMERTFKRDYIEIPVHIKYGFTFMGLNKVLVPYIFTGPNFSFLFNESKQDLWENRASNTAWDFGVGIELLKHLQLQAAYCVGITKTFKMQVDESPQDVVQGRDKCWTLTAAYLF